MPLFRKNARPAGTAQGPAAKTAPAPPAAPEPPAPPVDNLLGDPDAHRFRSELAEGRWQEFHDFLQATPDWTHRGFYVGKLASISGRPEWLDEWVAARPGSSLPYLFRGTHAKNWAWQARGGGRAKTVKEDAWPVFQARLVDADRDLARAAALDDRDPTPFAQAIWVAMGLSLGQAEIRRRFGEAERRDHLNGDANYSMVQALARKWFGSEREMFEFARSVSAQAPDGHRGHKMIALAHLEQWLDSPRGDAQRSYFLAEPVKAEIRAAADRSIRSPRYAAGRFAPIDRNVFAMCFRLMRDYDAQLEQMRLIGPLITTHPWHYQGKPGQAYERARLLALQKTTESAQGRPSL
jgi:hypothetical protein